MKFSPDIRDEPLQKLADFYGVSREAVEKIDYDARYKRAMGRLMDENDDDQDERD